MGSRISSFRKLLMVRPGLGPVTVADIDPGDTHDFEKKRARSQLAKAEREIAALQDRLWAERKQAVLVVLQGMDTSGKDGTIKHVMSGLNPQGVHVAAFKEPTPEERRHDFLWRIRRQVPEPGIIGIFNRSHYEDVLVARVDELASPEVIEQRYDRINRFEAELTRAGVRLVKVMLHVSFEEQRRRLIARLKDPTKQWKFSSGDLDKRARWADYWAAYDLVLNRCSPPEAPWYVVPADHRWFRNCAISHLLLETLREMTPHYPVPRLDVRRLLARLETRSNGAAVERTPAAAGSGLSR